MHDFKNLKVTQNFKNIQEILNFQEPSGFV